MEERSILHLRKKKSPLDHDDNKLSDSDLDLLDKLINLNKREEVKQTKKESKKNYLYDYDDDDKKSKKKKKKKKKDKKGKKEKKKRKSVLNLKALKIYDDEEDFNDEDKTKESENFYEYRFNSSLILLRDLLKEINENSEEARITLDELKKGYIGNNKIRLTPMAISTQMGTVASLLNSKLSVLKEITAVNKTISEFELKKQAANDKKSSASKGTDETSKYMVDKMFTELLNSDLPLDSIADISDEQAIETTKKKGKKPKKRYKSLDDRISELESTGELEFTDNEKAFKYETEGVRICIRKNLDTGRWKFFAMNSNGEEIADYPLPTKTMTGRVKFDEKTETAKDERNTIYDVYYTRNDELE